MGPCAASGGEKGSVQRLILSATCTLAFSGRVATYRPNTRRDRQRA
jgi:hypothetical protein